jgi:DNA-binding beta-propeller fold protein YncE
VQAPHAIAVHPTEDYLYVVSQNSGTVLKFDLDGNPLGSYYVGGELMNIDVDSSGNIFAFEQNNQSIKKIAQDGSVVATWGSSGSQDGEFSNNGGLAVDLQGNVYVGDVYNRRIQKFNSAGNFVTKWGVQGTADGQFEWIYGVAAADSGFIFVSDHQNGSQTVQQFDLNGNFIRGFGSGSCANGGIGGPIDLDTDTLGNVYVASNTCNEIVKFDSSGQEILRWGGAGNGPAQFNNLFAVAISASGYIFVADNNNNRVQKFCCVD